MLYIVLKDHRRVPITGRFKTKKGIAVNLPTGKTANRYELEFSRSSTRQVKWDEELDFPA